jgi:putative membrane protein
MIMKLAIQGFLIGLILVLPGMSGGTIFVILGMYENLLKDIKNLNLKPYIPLGLGAILGIALGGYMFGFLLETFRDLIVALLLGLLLASTRAILRDHLGINLKRGIFLVIGLIIGYLSSGENFGIGVTNENVSYLELFIGGALSSAVMIIPGVPGSSVLIVMDLYDSIFFYIRQFAISKLLVFGLGGIGGILLLSNIMEKLYSRYKSYLSYFFAGLIVGSARILIPHTINLPVIILFSMGFVMVWIWGGKTVIKS